MVDLSGLESFASLNDEVSSDSGLQEIDIDLIDESPNIGRPNYDQKKLEELAETIKERGVKSPISVHLHPTIDGRFIVNFGHRRLRASKIAAKKTIPAIIDEDFDVLDQAIENIQREDLEAVGVATIIQQSLKQGKSKSEIADRLGKPKSYVSDHVIFFELAEDIRALYDDKLCTSMRILAMLQRAYKKWPDEVIRYCREGSDFTASAITRLTEHLKDEGKGQKPTAPPTTADVGEGAIELSQESVEEEADIELTEPEANAEVEAGKAGVDDEWPGEYEESPSFEDEQNQSTYEPEIEHTDDDNGSTACAINGPGTHDDQPEFDSLASAGTDQVLDPDVPVVQVMVDGREGELKLCSSEDDNIWVQFYDSEEPELVPAGLVVIQRVG